MTSCKLHLTCRTSCELFLKLANPFSFTYPISPQQADIFSSEWSSSRAICSMKDIIWPTWGCIKFTSAVRKFKQNKWNMLILIDYIYRYVPIFCGLLFFLSSNLKKCLFQLLNVTLLNKILPFGCSPSPFNPCTIPV